MYEIASRPTSPRLTSTQTKIDVSLDKDEQIAKEFTIIGPPSCPAILVRKDGASGSVIVAGRGTAQEKPRVSTGKDRGRVIVIMEEGQQCIIYGSPSIRIFRSS